MPKKIDGSKITILSSEQYEAIKKCLGELYSKTKANAVLFADIAGQLIGERGDTSHINTTVLAALAAADFSATAEMAKLVGEEARFKLLFHEGEKNNVYLTNVGDEYFLIIIFQSNVALGMVRVYTKKAVEALDKIIKEGGSSKTVTDIIDDDFGELLANELDSSFKE
ncbi:MAG TPA: roadblock/LC7 domain-containing protein [Candidatus Limnocylindrales bacterium]|nr:roadblock/LC7 domain-containing protein [Candidatus Limnocylindrales bacterium]